MSVRLERVVRKRRRNDYSNHSSYNDEEEHVFRLRTGQRREEFGNHTPRRDNDKDEHNFRLKQGQRREELGTTRP